MPRMLSNEVNCVDDEVSLSKRHQILHPLWECDLMTVSENTSSSYFSALYNSLLWLRASIHAENTWNNQMCTCSLSLFFLPPSTRAQMHRHAQSHTHPLAHNTQTRHSCHVISLGIMPTAKHVTYQKSLRHSESERKREGEKFCTFVSLWELLVKSEYSSLHTLGTWDLAATVICNVVWCGGSQFWERKKRETRDLWDLMWNCSKEHAMFTVHCLNSWKASWKARSEPKQPKSLTFQDS